jgi:hypothetical protein
MSFPSFATGEVLTAADMNAVGLWLVKSQTIGTGVSSVTVTGAFSSDYNRYKITLDGGVGSTIADVQLRMGSTTTGYYGFLNYGTYTSNTVLGFALSNGANFGYAGAGSTETLFVDAEISNPFETKRTVLASRFAVAATTSSSAHFTGYLNDNTSYTAFTLIPSTGTFTGGTIRVYGYQK